MLRPCSRLPNCVSSQCGPDTSHYVTPLRYRGGVAGAKKRLIQTLNQFKRVALVKHEIDYIRVEFRSRIFRFVDDVEFYFPFEKQIIHVRSASRFGLWDFGVNRKRVTTIRQIFEGTYSKPRRRRPVDQK